MLDREESFMALCRDVRYANMATTNFLYPPYTVGLPRGFRVSPVSPSVGTRIAKLDSERTALLVGRENPDAPVKRSVLVRDANAERTGHRWTAVAKRCYDLVTSITHYPENPEMDPKNAWVGLTNKEIRMRSHKTYFKLTIETIAMLSIVGCGEFDQMPQAQVGQLAQFLDVSGPPRFSALAAGSDEQGPSRAAAESKCGSIYSDITKNTERRAACVKMFMAQYYSGIDKSFTVSGTIIEWADSETPLGKNARPYYQEIYDSSGTRLIGVKSFEAIWDTNGAVCLFDPRHMGLHYFNKPTGHNLPKCSVDPGNPNVPWLNNPFPGNGQQVISYRINHVATRFLIRNKTNGNIGPCEVMCSEPNQEVIETIFSPTGSYPSAPLRRKLPLSDPPQYEEDPDRYIKAKIWKSCDSSPSVHCDYITTAYDLSKPDVRRTLHLPVGKAFVLWDSSDINVIWLFKNATEPGAFGMHVWRVELDGRYFYITATESSIEKLGGRDPRKLWSEGFVYPNIVN